MSEFKIGDVCIIKGKPTRWASLLNKNCPFYNLSFPKMIKITEICNSNGYTAMTCGNYGWNLDNLIENGLIEKHADNNKKYKPRKLKFNGI